MKAKTWIITVGILLLVLLGAWYFGYAHSPSNKLTKSTPKQLVLFYGKGCPHCKETDEFIAKTNLHTKIKFVEKEVFHNRQNLTALIDYTKQCIGDNIKYIQVPLLWTGKTCLIGDQKIIHFFQERLNAKNK